MSEREDILPILTEQYELSLAIRSNKNPMVTTQQFFKRVMSRKRLSFIGIWLHQSLVVPDRYPVVYESTAGPNTFTAGPNTFTAGSNTSTAGSNTSTAGSNTSTAGSEYASAASDEKYSRYWCMPETISRKLNGSSEAFNQAEFPGGKPASFLCSNCPSSLRAFAELAPEGRISLFPMVESLGYIVMMSKQADAPMSKSELQRIDLLISKYVEALMHGFNSQRLEVEIQRRRDAELELFRRERQYRELVENAHELVWRIDQHGDWTFINVLGAKMILGFAQAELLGKSLLERSAPSHTRSDELMIQHLLCGEKISHYETRFLDREGQETHLLINAVPIFGQDGQVKGAAGTALDLTALHVSQKAQEELQKRLHRTDRFESIAEVTGKVAHDLNNLFAPVVAYPDMILDRLPLDTPVRKDLEAIKTAARHATEITSNLLSLSQRAPQKLSPMHLPTVVETFMNTPAWSGLLNRHIDVRFTSVLRPDTPTVSGVEVHLVRILLNLLTNACDALEESGTISIETGRTTRKPNAAGFEAIPAGEYGYLKVKDSGHGIPPEVYDRIFDPYFSSKKVSSSNGSGLGLSVVYSTVKECEGFLDVISRPDFGTAFIIYFPVHRFHASEIKIENFVRPKHLLIAEDDQNYQRLLMKIVQPYADHVHLAGSAREAIDLGGKYPMGLVLADLVMEEADSGIRAIQRLRLASPQLPAVLISGKFDDLTMDRAKRLNLPSVRKPYQESELLSAMRSALKPHAI